MGSARRQRSCVGASPPHHLRHRSSSVRLRRGQTWPLVLHTAAGINPVRRVPGSQDTAVPAVGADSVSHRRSVRQHSSPPRISAASHRLRGCVRFSVVAMCFYSTVSACSREPLYPASASVRAHSLGPFRPRPRRPSAHPFCCLSLPGSGSLRSPSPCAVKASQPSRTRPPPGPTLHFVPRPWSFRDSKADSRTNHGQNLNDITRIHGQPLRL